MLKQRIRCELSNPYGIIYFLLEDRRMTETCSSMVV
jgi:hypothetical protein